MKRVTRLNNPVALSRFFFKPSARGVALVLDRGIREGRFQRTLSLIAGASGLLSGLEVASQHYRGSYGQRVMYTPVALSSLLFGAGLAGAVSPRAARTIVPAASWLLLSDGVIGFGFHVRGIARKPGGWSLPIFNICMGPPIFAPLLLTIGGFLGVMAGTLEAEETQLSPWRGLLSPRHRRLQREIRQGRYARALGLAMTGSALLNGFESLYSHYKTNFPYKVQWTPIVLTPALALAGLGSALHPKSAHRYLPAASIVAMAAGTVGFGYHLRGVLRRPGGTKLALYNWTYGPPVFAPLLYAATGFLGLLAHVLNPGRKPRR